MKIDRKTQYNFHIDTIFNDCLGQPLGTIKMYQNIKL